MNEILQDPNLFIELFASIPNSKASNQISKRSSNYIQTKCKLITINTIHNNTHTIIKNGRQVGITTLIALYIIYYCLTNTNKKIMILANGNNSIANYHNIILHTLNNLNFIHSYNFSYTTNSKSQIDINSNKLYISSNISNLLGLGFDFVYLDDFAFCKDDINVISNLLPLLNYTKGKMVISSTPSQDYSMFNQIYQNSTHFKKVYFPNLDNRFKNIYDVEDYNVSFNAKIYPFTPKNNKIIKLLNN